MGRFTSRLSGRDTRYFDLFEAAAANIVRAAEVMDRMLIDWPDTDLGPEMVACEREGDRLTAAMITRLNQTFVSPIEREDILHLATGLDDVVDLMEECTDLMALYRIEAPMEQAQELAGILLACARQVAEAMPNLREFGDISAYTAEIHRLENEGDRATREAVASLFYDGVDPMFVIRWKDVFDRLEGAIDASERVANILSGIVIKNA